MKKLMKCLSIFVIVSLMALFLNIMTVKECLAGLGLTDILKEEPEKNEHTDDEKKQAVKDALSDDKITEEEEENLLEMYGDDKAALIKDMLPEVILNYIKNGLTESEIGRIRALVDLAGGDNETLAEALVTAFPKLNKDEMVTIFNSNPDKVNSNIEEYAKAGADAASDKNKSTDTDSSLYDENGNIKKSSPSVITDCGNQCDPNCTCGLKNCPSLSKGKSTGDSGDSGTTGDSGNSGNTKSNCVFNQDNNGGGGDNSTSQGTKDSFKPKDNSASNTRNPLQQEVQPVKSDETGTKLQITGINSKTIIHNKVLELVGGLTEDEVDSLGIWDELGNLIDKINSEYGIFACSTAMEITIDFTKYPLINKVKEDYIRYKDMSKEERIKNFPKCQEARGAKADAEKNALNSLAEPNIQYEKDDKVPKSYISSNKDYYGKKADISSMKTLAEVAIKSNIELIKSNYGQQSAIAAKVIYKAIAEGYNKDDRNYVLSAFDKMSDVEKKRFFESNLNLLQLIQKYK